MGLVFFSSIAASIFDQVEDLIQLLVHKISLRIDSVNLVCDCRKQGIAADVQMIDGID